MATKDTPTTKQKTLKDFYKEMPSQEQLIADMANNPDLVRAFINDTNKQTEAVLEAQAFKRCWIYGTIITIMVACCGVCAYNAHKNK